MPWWSAAKRSVLDNLATGGRMTALHAATFIHGDIADQALVGALIRDKPIAEIIHFADRWRCSIRSPIRSAISTTR